MSFIWFNDNLKPFLAGCKFNYYSFPDGDFGSLKRIEVEGKGKLATVEIWSEGWLGFDIVDCDLGEQVMNTLLSPNEKNDVTAAVDKFIKIMSC